MKISILFPFLSPYRRVIFAALLLCLSFSSGVLYAQSGASATVGKEFHISCLNHRYMAPQIQIKVVVEKACHITAKYNDLTNTYWYNWNNTPVDPGIYTLAANYTALVNGSTGITSKTMTITSDEDISVYVVNYYAASTDASVILPASIWGNEYRLATMGFSYAPSTSYATYSVVAKENTTEVTLHNGTKVNLDANQVYNFISSSTSEDLTGLKVSATKPIAVYSGHEILSGVPCPGLGGGGGSADHCYEQLWSTDKWGRDFFVWPVQVGNPGSDWGGMIGIVANETGTNVKISGGINGGTQLDYLLNAGGKQYVCYVMSGLCRIESEKPIMVFTVLPDAALTWIPPTSQRVPRAPLSPFIFVGTSNVVNHAIEMLIPAAYWNQTVITEDGALVVDKSDYHVSTYADFPEWITVRRTLANTNIKVDVSCPGGLLGYVYGWGTLESYGYLAGAGGYNLQNYFTIKERETTVDTYYENTAETAHTFKHSDNITVKRTVESDFTYVKWFINGVEYSITEDNNVMFNTLTFPASALVPGENIISMSVRYDGASSDVLYTGKVWQRYLLSFGDAPLSYDTAAHYLTDKLYLGSLWDPAKVQVGPFPSIDANTAENDDALTLTSTNGYTDLTQPGFTINSAGNLTSSFNVTNNTLLPANLTGWIDFNRNGVFDAGEAATPVTVPANSGSAPQVLTWTGAANRIMHGTTYLRLRLSTDAISQPKDTLNDGEVEDYILNLKLMDVTKTAVSDNPGDASRATLGDTITYTIHVENKTSSTLSNITVFDPIPLHSTYVAGSASPADGALATMSVGGQTVQVIKWNTFSLTSGANKGFSFKVAVTDLPQLHDPNDSIIANIAYALMNGDSITSTGNNCNLAEIVADSLKAIADTASAYAGIPINIDILGNDNLGHCNTSSIIVNISVPPASGGMVVIESDKTLTYTAPAAFSGDDSLTYTIKCNSTISTAKVRIKVHSMRPAAITDHLYLFTCKSKQTDVLANDANAASGTVTRIKDGTRGTATFSGGIMTYINNKSVSTCSTHGGKTDTVRYELCTPSGCSQANVIVHILRIPHTILVDSCSTGPYLLAEPQYKNATYQWYKSANGSTGWTSIPSATNARLSVTEDAWYKLEVTYNGDTVETAPVHFVIRTKHRLSSGSYWYDTTIH